jgi:hypothetical protein
MGKSLPTTNGLFVQWAVGDGPSRGRCFTRDAIKSSFWYLQSDFGRSVRGDVGFVRLFRGGNLAETIYLDQDADTEKVTCIFDRQWM